jgi:integrase
MCLYDMATVDVEGFRAHLLDLGLTKGTVGVYVGDVTTAFRGSGILARLRDPEIAPKTKRHILAASRHWAEFTSDTGLTAALKKLRLPPARRKKAKVPMDRADLFRLLDELKAATYIEPMAKAVIGLMASRGLRLGDVLRLTRQEVRRALSDGVLAYEAKGRRRIEFKVLKTFRPYLKAFEPERGDWERVDELISPEASPGGRRFAAARAIERALGKVAAALRIWGLYPHRLRRTYAVEYLRQLHGDPEAIIKLTQHMQWASMLTALEYVDHARGDELDGIAVRIFDREAEPPKARRPSRGRAGQLDAPLARK